METSDLPKKYQELAVEYSKVRSHVLVLKKAVLDEQTKNRELKDTVKELQQKVRKHNQEMDSLTFRNEQLTKRISVLQQELQIGIQSKKNKNKQTPNSTCNIDFEILDEELQKKILENAELVSTMADKDFELASNREKIELLENKILQLQKNIHDSNEQHQKEMEKCIEKIKILKCDKDDTSTNNDLDSYTQKTINENSNTFWQLEIDRWRTECELLRAKPENCDSFTKYYETQIGTLLEDQKLAYSEVNSLYAENEALIARMEQLILEKNRLESSIQTNTEEFHVTKSNYKSQLDAMTEHLAAQNEKITKQCDEIQILKHRLISKK